VEVGRFLNVWRLSVAFFFLAIASLVSSDADAKNNPPGCRNHNAAIHNPNCQGGSGTHITVAPKPTTANVQTIVVAPVTSQIGQTPGGGAGSAITTVTAKPPKTFTGYSPYYVPTLAPSMVPTLVPQQVPNKVPQAHPYLVPKQIVTPNPPRTTEGYSPYYVPTLAPTLTPFQIPNLVPSKAPQAIPNLVPNQVVTANPNQVFFGYSPYTLQPQSNMGPSGSVPGTLHPAQILLHRQHGGPIESGKNFIPPKPGRNLVYGYRAFHVDRDGVESVCVLSGLGSREIKNQVGVKWRTGHSEVLHFRSTSTAHLPSNRAQAGNHCLVSARKRIYQ